LKSQSGRSRKAVSLAAIAQLMPGVRVIDKRKKQP